jgi:hypothetical protein
MSDGEIKALKQVHSTRNAIAHSHVSLGRDYHLYRPSGGEEKEKEIQRILNTKPVENQSDPLMLSLSWHDDRKYLCFFNVMKILDEETFERLSLNIGIPHSRIR